MPTDIFSSNLAALAGRDPELHRRLCAAPPDPAYIVEQRGEESCLLRRGTGGEVLLYRTAAAQADLERSLANPSPPPRLVVYFGLGLGEHLDRLSRHEHPDLEGHLVLEGDLEVFRHFLASADRRDLLTDPRVLFCVGLNVEALQQALVAYLTRSPRYYYLSCLRNVVLTTLAATAPRYYFEAAEALRKAKEQVRLSFGNSSEDYFLGMRNLLTNIPVVRNSPTSAPLWNQFRGVPGVIVASGPSLDLAKPRLAELSDRALVLCCDSALKPALETGLRPHGVVSLERYAELAAFFSGFEIPEELPLFSLVVQDPSVLAAHPGPKVISSPHLRFSSWLLPWVPCFYTGPTVSTLALALLARFGCSPIAIIGNDLAYDTASGRSHLSGMLLDNDADLQDEIGPCHDEPGNSGAPVRTKASWVYFRDSFSFLVRDLNVRLLNVIPASHGLRLPGAERRDLDDLLANDLAAPLPGLRERLSSYLSPEAAEETERRETIGVKLREGVTYLQGLDGELRAFRARLESGSVAKIQELERAATGLIDGSPQFQDLLADLIAPFHLDIFNRYYAIPGQEHGNFDRKVELLKSWSEQLGSWAGRLAELLAAGADRSSPPRGGQV
ncbi:MAG: hypothetical protein A2284_03070 [Deltaproteobacteria bacterium RIFOXYA12_FULL_61_11]|nr:MAG: hypothetical protein A2284_03070 [Deltaproteobacteria bacterium RIFOXYA12_FULL_61_11]